METGWTGPRLTAHEDGLRRLARSLVFSDDEADDVVQQTYAQALEHKGPMPRQEGAWLRAVVRNVASNLRRGRGRQRRREQRAAGRDVTGSTVDTVARIEERELLLGAVKSLDPVHREVIVLRFLDGLPPRRVAERLGCPVATVKSRQQRALARLRGRLDALHGGDRRIWKAALTPWIGGIVMSSTVRASLLVLLVALLAGGAFFAYDAFVQRKQHTTETAGATEGDGPGAADPGPELKGRDAGAAGSGAFGREGGIVESEPVLSGRVVDMRSGRAIEGARVVAEDLVHGERLEAVTDAEGRYRFDGTEGRSSAFALRVEAEGLAPHVLQRVIPSRTSEAIPLQAGGFLEGRVVDPDGSVPKGCEILAVPRLFASAEDVDLGLWVYHVLSPDDLKVARVRPAADGGFRMGPLAAGAYALVLTTPDRAPVLDRGGAKSWDRTGGYEVVDGGVNDVGTLTLPPEAHVLVLVKDAHTREVLRDVTFQSVVSVDRRDYVFPLPQADIQPDGSWRLLLASEGRGLGANDLLVSAPDHASRLLSMSGGVPAGLRFTHFLPATARLHGRVLDEEGRPRSNAFVFVRQDSNAHVIERVAANDAGIFEIGDLQAGTSLEVIVMDEALERVVTMVPLTLQPGENRELTLGGPSVRALEIVVHEDGQPVPAAWISLDTSDDRRTQFTADADGRIRFDSIPAGRADLFLSIHDQATILQRSLDVSEEGVTRVLIDFRWEIEGRVLLENAEGERAPRDALTVEARCAGDPGSVMCESNTLPDGTFRIRLPAAGIWTLTPSTIESEVFLVIEGATVEVGGDEPPGEVQLVLSEDPKSGTAVITVRSAATGEVLPEGDYNYGWRSTRGAGLFDDGKIERMDLGYGVHTYVVAAPRHVSVVVTVEIGPERQHVETVASLPVADCVRIASVMPYERAKQAGVEEGDLLVRYGEARIRCVEDLRAAMQAAADEGEVRLTLRRDGVEVQLDIPAGRMGLNLANYRADLD